MSIEIHILQKFVDGVGDYFLCQRRVQGRDKPDFSAWIICPSVPVQIQGKQLGELPFNEVHAFYRSQTIANIALGKTYGPFQHGIEHGSFVFAGKVTCDVMKLIVHCYNEKISGHSEATNVMKQLTEDKKPL